jgi:hypothetical protein
MNFNINKNATLPRLVMELVKDGRYTYKEFNDKLQNSNITFCMSDIVTGVKKIGRKNATLILKNEYNGCNYEEYYISYQFSKKDTSTSGTYIGEFTIEFLDGSGTLIVPIRETLLINVLDQGIKK